MDTTDKKILKYLAEKDWTAESAIINETFKEFNVPKEDYIRRLNALADSDLVRYQRPVGDRPFVRITEKGRERTKSPSKRVWDYLVSHLLQILTLLAAVGALILSWWSL